MRTMLKTLLACGVAMAVAGPASAHGKVRVVVHAPQPYYAAVVHMAPRYVQAPVYVDYRPVYDDPYLQDRRAWRAHRREWRHRHGHGHGYGHRHHGCRDHWRH